ncbi:hypothetical protein HOG48_03230 [Candidatus Peregrinibacteria bacterium]|mgnify:CR=1 FL=1|jgi:hypothetical protein|nr:hypothetical protein [Candidatus Peregrinibacteria bacterium]
MDKNRLDRQEGNESSMEVSDLSFDKVFSINERKDDDINKKREEPETAEDKENLESFLEMTKLDEDLVRQTVSALKGYIEGLDAQDDVLNLITSSMWIPGREITPEDLEAFTNLVIHYHDEEGIKDLDVIIDLIFKRYSEGWLPEAAERLFLGASILSEKVEESEGNDSPSYARVREMGELSLKMERMIEEGEDFSSAELTPEEMALKYEMQEMLLKEVYQDRMASLFETLPEDASYREMAELFSEQVLANLPEEYESLSGYDGIVSEFLETGLYSLVEKHEEALANEDWDMVESLERNLDGYIEDARELARGE